MMLGVNPFRILYYKIFKYYTHDVTSKVGFTMVVSCVKISFCEGEVFSPRKYRRTHPTKTLYYYTLKRDEIPVRNKYFYSPDTAAFVQIVFKNKSETHLHVFFSPILWLTYFWKTINIKALELMYNIFLYAFSCAYLID